MIPDGTIIPRHIAFIMDGNGRWAEARGLPRYEGHRQGASTVRQVAEAAAELGVEAITLYCLSSENWKRPESELQFLMQLLRQFLIDERPVLMQNDLRLEVIGRRDRLPAEVIEAMETTLAMSAGNSRMRLVLAIDYGGRAEIAAAARQLATRVLAGQQAVEQIDESTLAAELYTAHLPDPDLLIRTGGDMRVSNFLLWQISYAELWVTERLWPDFNRDDLLAAIADFSARDRRFGGLGDGKSASPPSL
ncbi:polyprenyl diphosphate synthase [Planctomycetaceae bacterium SH139]